MKSKHLKWVIPLAAVAAILSVYVMIGINPDEDYCSQVRRTANMDRCTSIISPDALPPGSIIKAPTNDTPNVPLASARAKLLTEECLLPGARLAPFKFDAKGTQPRASSIKYVKKIDKKFAGGLTLDVPGVYGIALKAGGNSSSLLSLHAEISGVALLQLDELKLLRSLNDNAIAPDCIEYIRNSGFKLITNVLIANSFKHALETADRGSIDLKTAIAEGRVRIDAGPQANAEITSRLEAGADFPVTIAADLATDALLARIKIPTAAKAIANDGSVELNFRSDQRSIERMSARKGTSASISRDLGAPPNVPAVGSVIQVPIGSSLPSAVPPAIPGIVEVVRNEQSSKITSTASITPLSESRLLFTAQASVLNGVSTVRVRVGGAPTDLTIREFTSGEATATGKIEILKRYTRLERIEVRIEEKEIIAFSSPFVVVDVVRPNGGSLGRRTGRMKEMALVSYDVENPGLYTVSIVVTSTVLGGGSPGRAVLELAADLVGQ